MNASIPACRKRPDRGVFEKDGSWWVRLPIPGQTRKYRREKVGTYEQACAEFAPRLAALHVRLGPSVADAFDDFFTARPKVDASYHSHARHFLNRWGSEALLVDVAALPVLRAWQGERRETAAPSTVNHEMAFLAGVFSRAVEQGWLQLQPIGAGPGRLPYLRVTEHRTRWLLDDEEVRLAGAMTPVEWEAVAFAVHTGLRRSEQWRLGWADCTPTAVFVRASKTARARWVPLNPVAAEVLAARRGRGLARPFPGSSPATLSRAFARTVAKLELEDLTWHCLRHTFGTRLARAGVHQRIIQTLLGHATMAMSARYTHVTDVQLADGVARLCSVAQPVAVPAPARACEAPLAPPPEPTYWLEDLERVYGLPRGRALQEIELGRLRAYPVGVSYLVTLRDLAAWRAS